MIVVQCFAWVVLTLYLVFGIAFFLALFVPLVLLAFVGIIEIALLHRKPLIWRFVLGPYFKGAEWITKHGRIEDQLANLVTWASPALIDGKKRRP